MPKPTLAHFKKHIATLNQDDLRMELVKLFISVKEVPAFYAIGTQTPAEAAKAVKDLKAKMYKQFWTPSGNPRNSISNANLRKEILAFEKSGAAPADLLDVIIYRVELTTNYANEFGGTAEGDYTAASNAFDKAMELAHSQNLMTPEIQERCKQIFKADNLDPWYIEWLKDGYDKFFKR
jgi:Family of unknown function (DUF6155)